MLAYQRGFILLFLVVIFFAMSYYFVPFLLLLLSLIISSSHFPTFTSPRSYPDTPRRKEAPFHPLPIITFISICIAIFICISLPSGHTKSTLTLITYHRHHLRPRQTNTPCKHSIQSLAKTRQMRLVYLAVLVSGFGGLYDRGRRFNGGGQLGSALIL